MRRGTHPVVPCIFCTTETSDERPSTISSRTRGEGSRRSFAIGIEGCLRGIRDREEEEDPLGLDQLRGGRTSDELIGDLENGNPLVGVGGGIVRTPLREPDVASLETESALVRRDCRRDSYVHPAPFPPFTHVVQGSLASHLWRGEVSPPFPSVRL